MENTIDALYESGPCYVINKPAGLLTQAPAHIDSLERRMKEWLRLREGKTGNIYLGVPHRLDRPVSGAIVFARHVRAARRLSEQFESGGVEKVYWALVEGVVAPSIGEWRDAMRKVPNEPRAEIMPADHPDAREAVLEYRVLHGAEGVSLLEVRPRTGRMHQIRLQAASRGHPVLGDAMYGASTSFGEPFEDVRLRSIALHAWRLAFEHPMTREPVTVTAPLPQAWEAFANRFPKLAGE